MKRLIRVNFAVALLVVVAVACASAPPDRVALNTLQILKSTTDAAMKTANVLYQSGQLSEAQVRQLIADYDLYVAASKLASSALLALAQQPIAPTQAQVDTVMAPVRAASAKITTVVGSK